MYYVCMSTDKIGKEKRITITKVQYGYYDYTQLTR